MAKVVKTDGTHFEIWVHEPPDRGRANRAILEALSEELDIAKSRLSLLSGQTSRNKVFVVQ